jgi:hypothetical protein
MSTWNDAQDWESSWWGDCRNTYGEEEKQLLYANRMGLHVFHNGKSPYNIESKAKGIVDIGGGPVSLLLKVAGLRNKGAVVDPLEVPTWVLSRYAQAGIAFYNIPAEHFDPKKFAGVYEEAWIYNCLQHTDDPERIIRNVLESSKVVRIFEWINTRVNEGHPHSFTEEWLDDVLGGYGKTERLNGQANCFGDCYYGVFNGLNG